MDNIYFGKVEEEFSDGTEFDTKSGKFYYKIESDEEVFKISDTSGRMVPFEYSDIGPLIGSLDRLIVNRNLELFGNTKEYYQDSNG